MVKSLFFLSHDPPSLFPTAIPMGTMVIGESRTMSIPEKVTWREMIPSVVGNWDSRGRKYCGLQGKSS